MSVKIGALSEPVANILAKYSERALPLTRAAMKCAEEASTLQQLPAQSLFPGSRDPQACLSGLLLLLGCWDEAHQVAQDDSSAEGSYWHAIVHRIEPDAGNSGYWFRHTGRHPVFAGLNQRASEILAQSNVIGWRLKAQWDPFLFIEFCEQARQQPASEKERIALEIQKLEWELLFEWCASPLAH
jgi:hypothetical protein